MANENLKTEATIKNGPGGKKRKRKNANKILDPRPEGHPFDQARSPV